MVHQPNALMPIHNGGVNAALYAWTFLTTAVLGAGPWSLDTLLRRRTATRPTAADPAKTTSATSAAAEQVTEPATA